MSDIEKFVNVKDSVDLRFKDIWRIYDHQFNVLRDFLIQLGDKYVIEEFTGSVSRTLELSNKYSSNQVFVYINEVIQWKDKDYEETSSTRITLLHPRNVLDVIRVVIVRTNILKEDISQYVDYMNGIAEQYSEQISKISEYEDRIKSLEEEVRDLRSLVESLTSSEDNS